jgi:LPS-assembly protein
LARGGIARIALALAALFVAGGAVAQVEREFEGPSVFLADELEFDQELGIVTAKGHVEISQGERVLLADIVSYNRKTGTVIASGNVTLLEPTGDVAFADYVELDRELATGTIENIRILLADRSRFAANRAIRRDARFTELERAIYSPCELCVEDPTRAPLWQIKAVRVVHDQERHDIVYEDATFEVFGVPVAYLPYFRHPDPTVARRTGFLTPRYGSSDELGSYVEVPYYVVLAPYRDFTFTPKLTTREDAVFFGEWRERTPGGGFTIAGSITRTDRRDDSGLKVDGKETRGHVKADGLFDLDDTWRWGFDAYRSTDDTYLTRYDIDEADTLTSRLFAEAFRGQDHAAANAYFFQGLNQDDDPGTTPYILPLLDYEHVSRTGPEGSYATLAVNGLVLTRDDGTDSRRVSAGAAWHLPYVAPAGDVYALSAGLRGDIYHVDDVVTGAGATETGFSGRVVPEIALAWRYPFVRDGEAASAIVEPIVVGTLSPPGGNPRRIANEDSTDAELTDINLFEPQRFPGLDRVEDGPRASYGLRMGAYDDAGRRATVLVGQSYRAGDEDTFDAGSGLEGRFSDFVGRVDLAPAEWLDLVYRFRLDGSDLDFRRNEVEAIVGPPTLYLRVGYLSLSDKTSDVVEPDDRQEIALFGHAELGANWTVEGDLRSDLTGEGLISAGGGITYANECIVIGVKVRRRFVSDRDASEDTSYQLVVKLRHLG